MKVLKINGNKELSGTIRISGAKNSAVALIPATLLASEGISTICNIADITDNETLVNILEHLGAKVAHKGDSITVDCHKIENKFIPKNMTEKLRGSYYFMGALLSRFGEVKIHSPGGCNIGKRPIDLHLNAFKKMGATINIEDGNYHIFAEKLKGAEINLDIVSVGATINIMIAASLAEGTTVIENAACEPEVVNVATLLNNMGAKIFGAGTKTIKIQGVKTLHGAFDEVIPDRIEAGTYMIIGALCGNNIKITNIIPEHLSSLIGKLKDIGINIDIGEDYVIIYKSDKLLSTDIQTEVYPGFPTDLQQPLIPLLSYCKGKSIVEERIWEKRFGEVPELNKMGAIISVSENKCIVHGINKLSGTVVEASDLRAGASLVIAGLKASGTTIIKNINFILRGYENITMKLKEIGADIEIVEYQDTID